MQNKGFQDMPPRVDKLLLLIFRDIAIVRMVAIFPLSGCMTTSKNPSNAHARDGLSGCNLLEFRTAPEIEMGRMRCESLALHTHTEDAVRELRIPIRTSAVVQKIPYGKEGRCRGLAAIACSVSRRRQHQRIVQDDNLHDSVAVDDLQPREHPPVIVHIDRARASHDMVETFEHDFDDVVPGVIRNAEKRHMARAYLTADREPGNFDFGVFAEKQFRGAIEKCAPLGLFEFRYGHGP